MTDSSPEGTGFRRILSGAATEGERLAFEERILADPDFFQSMEREEADLLDAWARDELPEAESHHLEALFTASIEGRAKLTVARGLQEDRAHSFQIRPHRTRRHWLPIAACLVLVVATGWLGLTVWNQQWELAALRAALPPTVALDVREERASVDEAQRIKIPAKASSLLLKIDLAGLPPHDRYRVRILDAATVPVYEVAYLPAPTAEEPLVLSVSVSAEVLVDGRSSVVLEGLGEGEWVELGERRIWVVRGDF
jgi:hypothetical protein